GSTTLRLFADIDIAGQHVHRELPALPNQEFDFEWDGKDAYGRTLQGQQVATVHASRVVPLTYSGSTTLRRAFGQYGTTGVDLTKGRNTFTLTRTYRLVLG